MNKILKAVIINRKITLFLMALVMGFGLFSYAVMPRQESPEINVPVALLTTVFAGASAEDVESLVTKPIEDVCSEIDDVDKLQSFSVRNMSTVVVWLDIGANTEKSWDDLRRKITELQKKLPETCDTVSINTDVVEAAGMILSLSGEGYRYEDLAAYGSVLKDALTEINGISRMEVIGEQKLEVRITANMLQLNRYNISLSGLLNRLKAQNIQIPAGELKDGENSIPVTLHGAFASLEDIRNTVVFNAPGTGAVVRLKELADVAFVQEDGSARYRRNGENAVLLVGYFKKDLNIVTVGKDVRKEIDRIIQTFPEGMQVETVVFQPDDIEQSIRDFITNLLQGMLFVILVVLLGLGFRNAIIVSLAIPLSVLATFVLMKLFQVQLHAVSIASLIVSLGMLVDNAIVMSDAIQVHIDAGLDRMKACIQGVRQMAIPVLASTLTTIAVFIPLMLIDSNAGQYIATLPAIIAMALSASYVVAMLITPTLAYLFFRPSNKNARVSMTRRIFSFLLNKSLKIQWLSILFSLLLVVGSLLIVKSIGLSFFPKADMNRLYINIKTDRDKGLDETTRAVDAVHAALKQQPEVIGVTDAIGNGMPKFMSTMGLPQKAKDRAQLLIDVNLAKGGRFQNNTALSDWLQKILEEEVDGAHVSVQEFENSVPIGHPIVLRFYGNDVDALGRVSDEVVSFLSSIPGTTKADSDFKDKTFTYKVNIQSDLASQIGLTQYDIENEVSIALNGRNVSVYRKSGKDYDIRLTSDIETVESLKQLGLLTAAGKKAALDSVSDIRLTPEIQQLTRYNKKLSATVFCDLLTGVDSTRIEAQVREHLAQMSLEDISYVFDGEQDAIFDNFGDIGVMAVFALLLIYGILMLQFRSFLQPIIILMTIPLSAFGSALGLLIAGMPLSFMALLGAVSLMGIVVNNAIILLDCINLRRKDGASIDLACHEASGMRFRPIMLTTITTVIGLLPLIYSGSPNFVAMAVSLMSGLIVSTVLTLILIPTVYALVIREKNPQNPSFDSDSI